MDDGGTPDPDDVTALESVWGPEASATAPGSPRPDLDAPLGSASAGTDADGEPGVDRSGRGRLLGGVALAVVGLAIVGLVLLAVGEEGDAPDSRSGPATTAAPAEVVLDDPAWTWPASCPGAPEADGSGGSACSVAADSDLVYVLAEVAGVPTVQALAADQGDLRWEAALPEGAGDVVRLSSVVLAVGVGESPEVVAIDPFVGSIRWRRAGGFVGALGGDHVLLDSRVPEGPSSTSTLAVVEAASGDVVLQRTGPADELAVHPCGGADLAVAHEDGVLTGYGVTDGLARWSTRVAPAAGHEPVACDADSVAFVEGGRLHLLDAATGEEVATAPLAPTGSADPGQVLAVAGGTVVVGAVDGAWAFRADASAVQLWRLACSPCAPGLQAGPAGNDVVVVLGAEAVVPRASGRAGPRLDLAEPTEVRLLDDTLVAWGADEVVVADTADLGRVARLELGGVGAAVATPTHLVVTTADEVRAYPREG